MKVTKLLLCFIMMIMTATTTNAVEKEVNGIPYVQLNNGSWMPRFGIGTFNVPGDSTAADAVSYALQCGYRHIDTAHAYGVERGVGKAVKESGIPRDEIWITSKLWPSEYGEGKTMEAIDKMLGRLQTDHIDLLYVHQAIGDFRGAWKDMEKAVKQGKVRALGISNFDYADTLFHAIVDNAEIKPAVMQIELHPYAQRTKWQEKAKKYGIQIECWFPLGGEMSKGALFEDPLSRLLPRRTARLLHRLSSVGISRRASPSYQEPLVMITSRRTSASSISNYLMKKWLRCAVSTRRRDSSLWDMNN